MEPTTIFIDRWEYSAGVREVSRWKLVKRPPLLFDEMKMLKPRVSSASAMAFKISGNENVQYEDNPVSGSALLGVSRRIF